MRRLLAVLGVLALVAAPRSNGGGSSLADFVLSGVIQQTDDGDISTFSLDWILSLGTDSSDATIQFPAFPLVSGKQKIKDVTERSANFTKGFEAVLAVTPPGSKPKVKTCKFQHIYLTSGPDQVAGSAKIEYSQRLSGKRHKIRLLGYFESVTM